MKVLFLTLLISLHLFSLDIMVANTQDKQVSIESVETVKFQRLINRSLNKSLKKLKKDKHQLPDMRLNYVVIGLASDIRVGFLNWNLGVGKSLEFHYKR